jgi:Sortilin, neurotensin receptor 3,
MTMTPNPPPAPQWGNLLKSNSNGTYFGLSLDNVNRNDRGYVDYEKLVGLDGIILVNVVANTNEARISGSKKLQTRITHNDGGTWKTVTPPLKDSLGNGYECSGTVRIALISRVKANAERYCNIEMLTAPTRIYRPTRPKSNVQQSLCARCHDGCWKRW